MIKRKINDLDGAMSNIVLVEADAIKDPMMCALMLMRESWLHRGWTVGDVSRIICPPIKNNDAVFFISKNDGVVALATWGLFSKEVSEGFAEGKNPIEISHWGSGSCLWVIDFIGTKGMVSQLVRLLKCHLKIKYPEHRDVFAVRQYRGRRNRRRLSHWSLNVEGIKGGDSVECSSERRS